MITAYNDEGIYITAENGSQVIGYVTKYAIFMSFHEASFSKMCNIYAK